jgi:phosphate ABC transporter permease subunit PstA
MSAASIAAAQVVTSTLVSGKSKDRDLRSILFLGALWFSLFFGVIVLVALIVDTAIKGSGRFDKELVTNYASVIFPATTGFKAGIFGTIWLMVCTAVLAIPLGVMAATYLEEFADTGKWWNRLIEVNLQNLAAVPSIVYGLLAVAVVAVIGFDEKGVLIGGAVALALLILPVIIITTREAIRAVPQDIRQASYGLGATTWQTTWRQVLPSAVPGIATGTILGLSRAIGEAAPLIVVGLGVSVLAVPEPGLAGLSDSATSLPNQIYNLANQSRPEFATAASAAIILLLVMILGMNAIAILIRNKFTRSW